MEDIKELKIKLGQNESYIEELEETIKILKLENKQLEGKVKNLSHNLNKLSEKYQEDKETLKLEPQLKILYNQIERLEKERESIKNQRDVFIVKFNELCRDQNL